MHSVPFGKLPIFGKWAAEWPEAVGSTASWGRAAEGHDLDSRITSALRYATVKVWWPNLKAQSAGVIPSLEQERRAATTRPSWASSNLGRDGGDHPDADADYLDYLGSPDGRFAPGGVMSPMGLAP